MIYAGRTQASTERATNALNARPAPQPFSLRTARDKGERDLGAERHRSGRLRAPPLHLRRRAELLVSPKATPHVRRTEAHLQPGRRRCIQAAADFASRSGVGGCVPLSHFRANAKVLTAPRRSLTIRPPGPQGPAAPGQKNRPKAAVFDQAKPVRFRRPRQQGADRHRGYRDACFPASPGTRRHTG